MMRIIESKQAGKLLERRTARLSEAENVVKPILEAVRRRGDKALVEYAKKFDGLDRSTVRLHSDELAAAAETLSPEFRAAVDTAARNVRAFSQLQLPKSQIRRFAPGLNIGYVVRPLDTVAAYIPGGRYPLPSTLIMTAVPAQAAGVPNICACSPKPAPAVLGTAHLLGLSQVFHMGGAQAVAAFAYGTRTVPKADRIVGPGNIYVAAAKKLLAGEVGIDFVAGPTEVMIIAPEGNPRFIAADLLAQAEHDVDAAAILLTPSTRLARAVAAEIERQLKDLPTAKVARKSIEKNGAIVVVQSIDEALDLANRFAPEHLSVHHEAVLDRIQNAGAIFIGPFSPEAAGDYASGPNHVLPTSGAARVRGGLSAADFVKVISVQHLSADALRRLTGTVATLARAEGLEAHARSVELRLEGDSANG
jgi:histidinol dehydrogenase